VYRYENIVVLVATSEGVSRREIGRHRWAELMFMWNMPKEGFQQLYEKLPGPKPSLDDVWRWTGGNPYMLRELYVKRWDVEKVVKGVVGTKELTADFARRWGRWLREVVDDPEALWGRGAPQELLDELIAKNLVVYNMYERDPHFWVDQPPPERDPELGIGKHVAWQTPIHREAVRRALED
jgi:hypothetical protein